MTIQEILDIQEQLKVGEVYSLIDLQKILKVDKDHNVFHELFKLGSCKKVSEQRYEITQLYDLFTLLHIHEKNCNYRITDMSNPLQDVAILNPKLWFDGGIYAIKYYDSRLQVGATTELIKSYRDNYYMGDGLCTDFIVLEVMNDSTPQEINHRKKEWLKMLTKLNQSAPKNNQYKTIQDIDT